MTDTTTERLPWDDEPAPAAPDPTSGEADQARRPEAYGLPTPSTEVALLEARALGDLLDVRDPAVIQRGVGAIRNELVDAVQRIAAAGRAARETEIAHATDLRPEATRLADAVDVLRGVGGAFITAADVATSAACDLIDDLPGRTNAEGDTVRPKSFRVADGHGSDLVAGRDQRTELSVDHAAVDDVIVARLTDLAEREPADLEAPVVAYARGLRDGLNKLRTLLASSPTYRSTALEAFVRELEDADDDTLAKRLAASYARVDKGDPKPKLERAEPGKPRGGRR